MTLLWNNEDTNHLKTSGLDSFAVTGLGTFTAASNQMISASETTCEVLFHLEKDSYNYEWRSGRKGQALVLESAFSLKRETTSISPPSAPSGHTPERRFSKIGAGDVQINCIAPNMDVTDLVQLLRIRCVDLVATLGIGGRTPTALTR